MADQRMQAFQQTVWDYYHQHGRHDLPWRQPSRGGQFNPYHIVVSEIMLQQTQVGRVIPKYEAFISRFPSFAALAEAPLAEVIKAWSGLGYNRRAKFLWECAQAVTAKYNGKLPQTTLELTALPGIGPNTAGAVVAYAFNKPVVFIETNIRTVFIHHFFADQHGVTDRAILDLAARALPDDSRSWYWALMDYGSYLKQTVGNLNTLSKHYTKQSTFEGSRRQIRGHVLRLLGKQPHTRAALNKSITDERLESVMTDLVREGFVSKTGRFYHLQT